MHIRHQKLNGKIFRDTIIEYKLTTFKLPLPSKNHFRDYVRDELLDFISARANWFWVVVVGYKFNPNQTKAQLYHLPMN